MEYIYEKHQLVEVICQLRYPRILSIESKSPADFQDAIRHRFPRYLLKEESLPDGKTVHHHSFFTEDSSCKVSLTQDFIAFSTVKYRSWGEFAALLDEALAAFISEYRPAFFERIGIRYINAVSREALGLEECPWRDLISPEYLGPLADAGVEEGEFRKVSVDLERCLSDGDLCKIHAGPAVIERRIHTPQGLRQIREQHPRFLFDLDLSHSTKLVLAEAAPTIDRLHGHADRIFSAAITEQLHEAMAAVYL